MNFLLGPRSNSLFFMKPIDTLNFCEYCCNFQCSCIKTTKSRDKFVDKVITIKIKGKKYVTRAYGNIDPIDLKKIKKTLGTGGTQGQGYIELRGSIVENVKSILSSLEYSFD